MSDTVQIKATIPRELKRQAFSAFALREEKFAPWLCKQLEQLVVETRNLEGNHGDRLVGSQARG